jgi:Ca2+-binding RTX toxin-like protein
MTDCKKTYEENMEDHDNDWCEDENDYEYSHQSNDVVVYDVITVTNTVVNEVANVIVNEVVNVNTVNVVVDVAEPPTTKNYIYGTRRKDYLTGTDLNDVIKAYQGNDVLIDGLGSDILKGGKGKNTYSVTADGSIDMVKIQKDNRIDEIVSIGLEDRIVMGSSHTTFGTVDEGIGIFYKNRLQVVYTGDDLTLEQIKTITV